MHRTQSPSFLQNSINPNASISLSSNALTGLIPSATDEVLKLRKEVKLVLNIAS